MWRWGHLGSRDKMTDTVWSTSAVLCIDICCFLEVKILHHTSSSLTDTAADSHERVGFFNWDILCASNWDILSHLRNVSLKVNGCFNKLLQHLNWE